MTREHLFRGFHPDENGTTIITLNEIQIKGEWIKGDLIENQGDYYIYHANSGDTWIRVCYDNEIVVRGYKVIPETVGEFIGKTDKNGKKIFEDDIVTIITSNNYGNINGFTGIVVYNDCGFELLNIEDTECLECIWYKNSELEVIGNIHDNPELLEDVE